MRKETSGCCIAMLVVLWLGLNVADGFWIYFYVHGVVDPIPRNAVNRTGSGWTGYTTMMFFFGLPWGIANLVMSWWIFVSVLKGRMMFTSTFMRVSLALFAIFVVIPVGVFITMIPFFGGWIVTPIVQTWTYHHRCDDYPMYAILDVKAYNGPSYVKNVAYFYINGNNNMQFTYEISNPEDDDQWFFRLRRWNVEQSTIPIDFYPTLQSVGYNFETGVLSGNCTVPSSPSATDNSTTTNSCVTGTFEQGTKDFFFNVTSTIPLNNTANASATELPPHTWAYATLLALILREQDGIDGALDNIVLRTAVVKPHDCTELKVCIAGVKGREGGPVMAEVLGPLGVLLMRQVDYGVECSQPVDP
ncbi:hypothetical protein BC629DRAFT_1435371 [Irpex lacteus]|nr:hypothetical protein BC629DRAFT_1435371 [Irpex lacteus]